MQLDASSRHVKNSSGASMFGPDSGKWPAWWFDAVRLLEINRVLAHNAFVEATRRR